MRQLDTYWDGEHSCKSPDRNIEKNENPPRWPFRNWLILNGHRGGIFIFFFFGPVDCTKCSRGWGGGGARDWERGPQNRRGVADECPGFEYISRRIYYIFVVWRPFCDNLTILSQNMIVSLWVHIHFWSKKSPLYHSLVLSMKFRLKSFLAWITIWKSPWLSLYNVFLGVKLPRMSWTPLYIYEGRKSKSENPWDDVVTYWNFDEFIEIYIHNTIWLSSYELFQFECL